MKVLIFGASGQVGREVVRRAPADWRVSALSRAQADLADPEACADAIRTEAPDVIVNAAAFTAVDAAESEPGAAKLVNGVAPGVMARAAAARGVAFVHLSTDYVFDGGGTRPWAPSDEARPLSVYGRSKLNGEAQVVAAGGCYAIVRTSWVFSAHGHNFVRSMLRLAEAQTQVRVVADQIGGPTPAAALASALCIVAASLPTKPSRAGVYHFAGAPEVSWADFARAIFDAANRRVEVVDIASAAYPTAARRPLNSRLDCSSFEAEFGVTRPDWRRGLTDVLAELEAS